MIGEIVFVGVWYALSWAGEKFFGFPIWGIVYGALALLVCQFVLTLVAA